MMNNIRLWCCPHFKREVETATPECNGFSDISIHTSSFDCPLGSRHGRRGETFGVPPQDQNGIDVVIGGGCLQKRQPPDHRLKNVKTLSPDHCFYLVAPAALVDSLIAEGAYLMTPDWLSEWRMHMEEWGFNRETATLFFQETTRKLVLLDTGISGNCLDALTDMGNFIGLPYQSISVGLDLLKLYLERTVVEIGQAPKTVQPPHNFFADHLMIIDLLSELLASLNEKEAIERMEELFHLLFAPGRMNYSPDIAPGHASQTHSDKGFHWTESGRGFVIFLNHQGYTMGSLELDDLAFVEYKDRYLTLALSLAKVCALAVSTARAREIQAKTEHAIRRMAGIVNTSGDAIIGKSLDGVIASWNEGAHRIFGYTPDEVLGRNISFLTPMDRPDVMPRMLDKIAAGQPTQPVETTWMAKDGHHIDVSLQVSPICDDHGKIVGASSISRDITAEKQKIDKERRSLKAQLQQAQKLETVGRLAGGVAHDFNNMLAIILGFCDLTLTGDTPLDPEITENLKEIREAGEKAKGITRQLLAFARKQVLEMSSLNLNTVIMNFSKMIKRLIGEDITIDLRLTDDLPYVNADVSMIEQILLNLVVNARDAMMDGGVLTLETQPTNLDQTYADKKFDVVPGDYIMMSITDTGMGMDEETRQMIFEPFFTTKAPGKGTGLGLSTVYGIVKQHNGLIWVYSEPGQGTIFKLYFPVAGTDAIITPKDSEMPLPFVCSETILVVEDEAKLRLLIRSALNRIGYKVLCAGTPDEARSLVQKYDGAIHLMLTDVVMPGINGKMLYESLKILRPDMKVIFMSGYTEDVIVYRGILKEGINFIQKPFTINQLARKLGAILTSPPPGGQPPGVTH